MFNIWNAVPRNSNLLVVAICFSMSAIASGRADTCVALSHTVAPQRMAAMKSAWADLAQVMRSFSPDRIFAELLNEPDVKAERWQGEAEELAVFVRRLLPDTTLIVGPVNWQRADSLPAFRPLPDLNIV